jgi:hypothetical protein
LSWTEEDIATNLSLQEKLRQEFDIELPRMPDVEDLSPDEYFTQVAEAIRDKQRWEVLPNDIVLWFFSFAKFLMYRDLEPKNWPPERSLSAHPLISGLLDLGFKGDPPICDDNGRVDHILAPRETVHVVDADSSQAITIEEARRGRNLVVQGPPGTGKSQTITNIIAATVKDGKKVLFVAEKMAALEVVHRRLTNIGLGDMCLELHSHKAHKRAVLEKLGHTLSLGKPKTDGIESHAEELRRYQQKLNRHAEILHAHLAPAGPSPYQIMGELVRLRARKVQPAEIKLTQPLNWSNIAFARKSACSVI